MLTTVVVFVLILGLLIFVHELGHFLTAKKAGVKVEEFGFGYPPRIFGIKRGETIYSINLLPIGGFVKIFGEDGPEQEKTKEGSRAFYNQSIWKRALILIAGIAMNFLLAAVLLCFCFWYGLPEVIDDNNAIGLKDVKVQISDIAAGSPAQEAGLQIGDAIIAIEINNNRIEVQTAQNILDFVADNLGRELLITVSRGGENLEKTVVARSEHPADEGPLGVGLVKTAIVSYPWYQAIAKGFLSVFEMTWLILSAFAGLVWQLILSGRVSGEVAGPVGIFSLTGQAAKLGFVYVLQFTALLSINLAIINGLPFPALDGGRLLFLLIEKIKGSPVSPKIERTVHTVGFAFLIILMVAITWRDVVRLF